MEFKFNVNKLLPKKINKVTHTLIPEDFKGDRRELNECQRQLTRVLDEMGEASARAQGLNKPITSALKLRDTDHVVYLLVDNEANNGMGSVVGLLKTGSKHLFMFDEIGAHYQLRPRCILDFYIHESRQRTGLGNMLYQHMLTEENIKPVKLAIDRPSEKFLAFLRKYYGLSSIIPQNNKFVVFQGFFEDENQEKRSNRYSSMSRNGLENNTSVNENNNVKTSNNINNIQYQQPTSRVSYGRYAAARPPCSMANIIHNTAMLGQSTERTGLNRRSSSSRNSDIAERSVDRQRRNSIDRRSERSAEPSVEPPVESSIEPERPADLRLQTEMRPKVERPRSLSLYSEEEQKQRNTEMSTVPTPTIPNRQPLSYIAMMEPEKKPEKTVKSSPSCAQEVTGNQHVAHLDLKFYHSPLW